MPGILIKWSNYHVGKEDGTNQELFNVESYRIFKE